MACNHDFAAPARASPHLTLPVLVLHHGVCGFGDFQIGPLALAYFQGIDLALLDKGFSMINTRVHPTAGIATRAMQLKAADPR